MRKTLVRLLSCGIVLTGFVDDDKVLPVIEAGALSYLLKTAKSREIADALYISVKTVKTHITHILSKLELTDRTQAAIYAHRNKLVGD